MADHIKQLSFYTDCLGKCHWSVPEQIIGRDMALAFVSTAEILVKTRETTTEEIELWIQYLKPYWKHSDQARASALFDWDKEMRKRGIIADDGVSIETFFREGIKKPN